LELSSNKIACFFLFMKSGDYHGTLVCISIGMKSFSRF
jgi:hypothetical protein